MRDVHLHNERSFEDYCNDSVLLQSVLFRPQHIGMTEQSLRSNVVPAEKLLNRLNEMGIDVITEIDNEYPDKLKNSLGKDCPPVLFVGARRIAPYIDVDDDRSNSFKVLIEGLNKLV